MIDDCRCASIGYYKRFDRPLPRADNVPKYKNVYSTYAKDYFPKQGPSTAGEDCRSKLSGGAGDERSKLSARVEGMKSKQSGQMDQHRPAKTSSILPNTYVSSYGKDFDAELINGKTKKT